MITVTEIVEKDFACSGKKRVNHSGRRPKGYLTKRNFAKYYNVDLLYQRVNPFKNIMESKIDDLKWITSKFYKASQDGEHNASSLALELKDWLADIRTSLDEFEESL